MHATTQIRSGSEARPAEDDGTVWVPAYVAAVRTTQPLPPDFDERMRVVGVSLVDRHSTQVSATSLHEVDNVVASLDIRPGGMVLLADDLSSPDNGTPPKTSDAPIAYDYGYRNGGYAFVDVDPNWSEW